MIGITGYSAYVPRWRLDRALIAAAWGSKQARGEIAVANYDEDSVTLAVEAALGCLEERATPPDGVYFASTSSPYAEKQIASLVATACDLPRRVETADFGGSARAGMAAVRAALRTVQAGAASSILVTAADVRVADPESELEGSLGAGAAALCVADRELIAEFVDATAVSEEFTYLWRTEGTRTVQANSGKFSNTFGYLRDFREAIQMLLERQGLKPSDIAALALYSPDGRATRDLARSLGFGPTSLTSVSVTEKVGCTGCAEPLLVLADVLDRAGPEQLVLVGSYGEGADVMLFRTTEALTTRRAAVSVQQWVDSREPLPSYVRYLKYRRLIPAEEVTELVTNVLQFKELKQNLRLYGSRCRRCGTVQYPMAHACIGCRTRGDLEDVKISHRGTVFTYTVDHLAASFEHPLPMVVVDMDGGGRLYLQLTDADTVAIGTPVTLSLRFLHEGGGNRNYYWKARPIRERGD